MRRTKNRTFFVSILAICTVLPACAKNQTMQATQAMQQDAMAVSQTPAAQQPTKYVIHPGDQLDIKFFFNPELNESVVVRPDGKISLQLVDEVVAAGLEPSQLDEFLTEKYAKELKKPVITVIVRSFEGQRIYVGGEVKRQREMTLLSGMTVLQAVFQAGGFLETASPENTILIRQGPNKEPMSIQMDLENAMYGKGHGANLVLQPNDIVYVPKSAIAEANKWVSQYIEKLILFRGVSFGVNYQLNQSNND